MRWDQTYESWFRGKFEAATVDTIDGNVAEMKVSLPEFDLQSRMGRADELQSVSLRVCKDAVSVIAVYLYRDCDLNIQGCYACCTCNGIKSCVYGSNDCWCECV